MPTANGAHGPASAPALPAADSKKAQKADRKAAAKAKAEAKSAAPAPAKSEPKKDKAKSTTPAAQPFVNRTPHGEKKDLSAEMDATFDPAAVEAAWYAWWEECGFFKPALDAHGHPRAEGTFTVPIPPPNVTGDLHLGHALTVAVQDCLVRWYRMRGFTVLYNPGFDHAGIATQTVVEKRLMKEKGQTRHDLGRETFLELVHQWKDQYQDRISNQLRSLGASYDWTRSQFTMNEQLSKAVVEAFCRLHDDGTIYRANRLVNYCCFLKTTLSNLEVDQKELMGRTYLSVPGYGPDEKFEFGALTQFSYPIADSDEKIVVATTRPETMLGDTAIAVHPDDPRYKHLHGKYARHPFVPERKLPIVCDSIAVDMAFGTGAVKITPAHDFNDFAVGTRHKLELINILDDDGVLNDNCGKFAGVKRLRARGMVKHELKLLGLLGDTLPNPMSVPICSRSGDVIEPLMKPQWWVACKDMADESLRRTDVGELKIRPSTSANEWQSWMKGTLDWCISRQLWWGHRCPIYLVAVEGEPAPDPASGDSWVNGRTREEAEHKAQTLHPGKRVTLSQDEDVLDTWFSSGLWPFSLMGWPEKTRDLELFYPNSLLETGWDILPFWVARMVMLGIKLTGRMPFPEVYCHGLVRDAQGRKMSKSLGNTINPLDVIHSITLEGLAERVRNGNLADKEVELALANQRKMFPHGIPACGTDALRFTLCNYTTGARDANLDVERVHGYRMWANKLWNMTRFAMRTLDVDFVPHAKPQRTGAESMVERWVLDRMDRAVEHINANLEQRDFHHATEAVHSFQLHDVCDVFIEAMKPLASADALEETRRSVQQTLYTCLDVTFRLLHPFMPFVTEELWQRLPRREGDQCRSIMVAAFPHPDSSLRDAQAAADFDAAFDAVRAARALADSVGLRTELQWYVQIEDSRLREAIAAEELVLRTLVKGSQQVRIVADASNVPDGCLSEPCGAGAAVVYLLAAGRIDAAAEIAKIETKRSKAVQAKAMIERIKSDSLSDDVKRSNDDKIAARSAEIATFDQSIQRLHSLAL